MAYDPLSTATRKARTNLVFSSTSLFLITHFGITLSNIPGHGFEIETPDRFLNFCFIGGTIYFTVLFLIYMKDDIQSLQPHDGLKNSQLRAKHELDRLKQARIDLSRDGENTIFLKNIRGYKEIELDMGGIDRQINFIEEEIDEIHLSGHHASLTKTRRFVDFIVPPSSAICVLIYAFLNL